MMNRHKLTLLLTTLLLALTLLPTTGCESLNINVDQPQQPNVLFILTDDQRYDAISLHPNAVIKTPNIDRIGKEGIYFPNAFCTTSLCSPSRASILSGLYAHSHGVTNNFTEYPTDMPTYPKSLQAAGYKTAYIGKYHMGEQNDDKRPGFDHFVTHKGQGKYFDNTFRFNGGERKEIKGYYTNVVTDLSLQWLKQQEENKKQPWLLILGHKAPHSFYYPEEKYKDTFKNVAFPYPKTAFMLDDKPAWFKKRLDTWHGIYGPLFDWRKKFPDRSPEAVKDFEAMNRAYLATILSVDDSVGQLYQYLKDSGQLDNTLIIYTTDNGILSGEHGMVDKRTMHAPSIRLPLVVRYPGLTPPDQPKVIKEFILTQDFAPTIIDICNAKPLPKTHGQSFKRLARGDNSGWRTSWYYEYNYEKQFPYTPNVRGMMTTRYKYIRYPHGDGSPDKHMAELYDILKDPNETTNLFNKPEFAELIPELNAELKQLIKNADGHPDQMPIDAGIKSGLPDKDIR